MDIVFLSRAHASKRLEKSLHWEDIAMLSGTIVAEPNLTERITLLPESTPSYMRRAILEGFPDFVCIDDLQVGTFPLCDVVALAD